MNKAHVDGVKTVITMHHHSQELLDPCESLLVPSTERPQHVCFCLFANLFLNCCIYPSLEEFGTMQGIYDNEKHNFLFLKPIVPKLNQNNR